MASSVVWSPVEAYAEIYAVDEWGTKYTIGVDGEGDSYVLNQDTNRAVVLEHDRYRLCRATPGRALVVTDEVIAALEFALNSINVLYGDGRESGYWRHVNTLQAALNAARGDSDGNT